MPKTLALSSNDKNKLNFFLEIAGLISFLFIASAFVLSFEYREGNFLFKFLKAKIYYGNFNKIIIPIYFWLSVAGFLIYQWVIDKSFVSKKNIIRLLKFAFLLHLYLILLTHSAELTPGFSLIPVHLPTLPYSVLYAKVFIHTFFIGYYLFSIYIIRSRVLSFEWIIPLAFLIPFFFGYSWELHLVYVICAFGLFILREKIDFSMVVNFYHKKSSLLVLLSLFLLSLGFRLWYASYITWVDGVGLSADGPAYFQAAKDFAFGDFSKADYWHAPIYSLYLSIFIKIFGADPSSVFYSQAVIGSLLPILIVKIVGKLHDEKTAVVAGFLTAVFPLCIHFSVVLNRASLQILILASLVYFCLTLKENFSKSWFFVFGAFLGIGFYLGQATIPILIFLAVYSLRETLSQSIVRSEFIKKTGCMILGMIVSFAPLNGIFYSHSGKLIPLGRDASLVHTQQGLDRSWVYGGSEYSIQLEKLGFNPLKSPFSSLEQLVSQPLEILPLYFKRFLDELSGFLFDPGSMYIAPLNLEFESFYGAHIQFYFYFFIFIGTVQFLRTADIDRWKKSLVLLPIIFQTLVISFLLIGTFRYRAPVEPFYLILASFGIRSLFIGNLNKESFKGFFSNSILVGFLWGGYAVFVLCLFLGTISFTRGEKKDLVSSYNLDPWLNLIDNQLKGVHFVSLNGTVFSFYHKTSNGELSNKKLSFNICRFLMPGKKPYYVLLLDGEKLGDAKEIPHGCTEVSEMFNPSFDTGVLSLFVYFSPDGKTLPPQNIQINSEDKRQAFTLPILTLPQNPEIAQYKAKFDVFSLGFVKMSRPVIR